MRELFHHHPHLTIMLIKDAAELFFETYLQLLKPLSKPDAFKAFDMAGFSRAALNIRDIALHVMDLCPRMQEYKIPSGV